MPVTRGFLGGKAHLSDRLMESFSADLATTARDTHRIRFSAQALDDLARIVPGTEIVLPIEAYETDRGVGLTEDTYDYETDSNRSKQIIAGYIDSADVVDDPHIARMHTLRVSGRLYYKVLPLALGMNLVAVCRLTSSDVTTEITGAINIIRCRKLLQVMMWMDNSNPYVRKIEVEKAKSPFLN